MKRLVKCSIQPVKASTTWTIYMDYDDDFGRHTVSEEFTGSWSELRDYMKDLKNTDYYNIDAVEHAILNYSSIV